MTTEKARVKESQAGAPGSALAELQAEMVRQWNEKGCLKMSARLFKIWMQASDDCGKWISCTHGCILPEPPREPLRISLLGW